MQLEERELVMLGVVVMLNAQCQIAQLTPRDRFSKSGVADLGQG